MKNINISHELAAILNKAVETKIYGSVEIFFEQGIITQITQRIIKKMAKQLTKKAILVPTSKVAHKNKMARSQSEIGITNPL